MQIENGFQQFLDLQSYAYGAVSCENVSKFVVGHLK